MGQPGWDFDALPALGPRAPQRRRRRLRPAQRGQRLAAALASLPGRQRQVLVLRFVEDLSEQATSGALGCSVGTVKSTASRGLARLRDLLVVGAGGSAQTTSRRVLLVVRARQERANDEPARTARGSCPAGAIRPAGGCRPPTTELHVRSGADP